MKAALHVLALPHTRTDGTFPTCAYTAKVEKFCRMMHGRDRPLVLYGPEGNTAPCDEHVVTVRAYEQEKWFGTPDPNDLSYGGFSFEANKPWWIVSNARAIAEIGQRDEHDLVLPIGGDCQQMAADHLPNVVAEFGVGYMGVIERDKAFCAYESHGHRHLMYGKRDIYLDPPLLDCVIPNYFDPDELPVGEGGETLLFIGRLVTRKGPHVAASIADACGMPLRVAGQGATSYGTGFVEFDGGRAQSNGLEYMGVVGPAERAWLYGNSAVTIVPTLYAEPFGGVAVESMMCGTPVVATDLGAFVETVEPGMTGFRFRMLQEAIDGVRAAMALDRGVVAARARERFSLAAVRPLYEEWFDALDTLWGEGFYTLRPPSAEVGSAS